MYSPEAVQLPPSFHNPNRSAIPPVQLLWEEYEAGVPLSLGLAENTVLCFLSDHGDYGHSGEGS